MLVLTALLCACADKSDPARAVTGADAARGFKIMEETGCAACHATPGIGWPKGRAGTSLAGFADRPMIAGRLPNQPDVLIAFVRDAPSVAPGTAMPAMPLTEAEARDVVAYLYTLHD